MWRTDIRTNERTNAHTDIHNYRYRLPQLSIYIILTKSFWFTSSDVRKNLMDLVSTPTLPVSLIFWECGYVNMWLLEHLEIIVQHPHPTQLISIFSPTSANHYHIFNILFFFRSLFDIILLETTNQIDTQVWYILWSHIQQMKYWLVWRIILCNEETSV